MILLDHTEKLDSILYRLPVQEQGAHFVIQVQYFIYIWCVISAMNDRKAKLRYNILMLLCRMVKIHMLLQHRSYVKEVLIGFIS